MRDPGVDQLSALLLGLNAGNARIFGPAFALRPHLGVTGGKVRNVPGQAELVHPPSHLGRGQGLIDQPVQLLDNIARRGRRHGHAEEAGELKARKGLGDGRHVGRRRRARQPRDRQRTQLAVLQI